MPSNTELEISETAAAQRAAAKRAAEQAAAAAAERAAAERAALVAEEAELKNKLDETRVALRSAYSTWENAKEKLNLRASEVGWDEAWQKAEPPDRYWNRRAAADAEFAVKSLEVAFNEALERYTEAKARVKPVTPRIGTRVAKRVASLFGQGGIPRGGKKKKSKRTKRKRSKRRRTKRKRTKRTKRRRTKKR